MVATETPALWPADPEAMRAAAAAFDIKRLEPRFLDDPYPLYRALREHDPVHRMPDGSYFLSRYDDCAAVYRDVATWSSDKKVDFRPNFGDSLLYEHHTTSLVFNDPPYHTRVRKLLAPAFTPRALKALQPRVEALVDRLLDAAAEGGRFDLIDDFASAIPVQLIGDMLGVPQAERGRLRDWSLSILGALEPVLSREQFACGTAAVAEFKDYLIDLVRRRLREKNSDEAEILSTLIGASAFDPRSAGERLSEVELLHNCIFLLNAGHETTTNLIGNGIDLLIRHPQAMRELRGAWRARTSSAIAAPPRIPRLTASPCRREPMSISASAPRTAIPRNFPIPSGSICAASRTATWPSPRASMPARECRSRAWKRRWRSGNSRAALPKSSATAPSSAAAAPASAASCTTLCGSAEGG